MKLEYINAKGSILNLTNNEHFQLSNVDGLNIANVDISSSTIGNIDGDFINSKRTIPRSIIFDLVLERNVTDNFRYVMQFVKPKQKATIRKTIKGEKLEISGIVESIETPRFTNKVIMQVSLYCSNPYWEKADYSIFEIAEAVDLHYFTEEPNDMLYFEDEGMPFGEINLFKNQTLINYGDVEVGIIFKIIATGRAVNPRIYNINGDFIGVNVEMNKNDELEISTKKGQKYIKLNNTNILSKLKEGSTWLQADTGETEFVIECDEDTKDNVYFICSFKEQYV